jgi:hypothetical protein
LNDHSTLRQLQDDVMADSAEWGSVGSHSDAKDKSAVMVVPPAFCRWESAIPTMNYSDPGYRKPLLRSLPNNRSLMNFLSVPIDRSSKRIPLDMVRYKTRSGHSIRNTLDSCWKNFFRTSWIQTSPKNCSGTSWNRHGGYK